MFVKRYVKVLNNFDDKVFFLIELVAACFSYTFSLVAYRN